MAAVRVLARSRRPVSITLIDRKDTFDFLPLLPDMIGRGIDQKFLKADLAAISLHNDFCFINDEVSGIDLKKKEIRTAHHAIPFDYALIASGSETNFYGNDGFRRQAFSVDSARDVAKILSRLHKKDYSHIVVCGGGYTGVEVATNAKLFADKHSPGVGVTIVERAATVVGQIPEWMRGYVAGNLDRMGIGVCADCSIRSVEGGRIEVSGGRSFSDAVLIWAAGVKTAGFIGAMDFQKNSQGRLFVDEYLRLDEATFAVGDAACFRHRDSVLRMSVQFAITQGLAAARNILCLIKGEPLRKYRPVDPGYIVPMANNRACGNVLGANITGILAIALHYCMCAYRSYGFANKVGVLAKLNGGGI